MAAAISTNEQLASLQRDFAPHLELQPPTERVACSLRPRANPTNYSDRKAFDPTGVLSADEATGMAELEALEARGLELCSALYTYRSIARALPTAGGDDENKRAMYLTSFEVLHPHVQRVKELMYYKDDAVAKFCASLALCTGPGSDGLLLALSRVFDVVAVLDSIKDTKACLSNDLSVYKRAFAHCRADVTNADAIFNSNNALQLFLAEKGPLLSALKAAVHRLPGAEESICAMAHLCAEALEGGWCLLPAERHRMLRACACLVWLLDCPAGGGPNAFLSRKLRRDRLGRLFKVSPVVPLYGDMHANLPLILRRCPNFSPAAAAELLPHSRREMESLTGSYDVVAAAGSLRSLVVDYTASLPALLRRADALGGRRLGRDERGALARAVYEQVLRGCRYMAAVHSRLSEFVAWKCAHPVGDAALAESAAGGPSEAINGYERALRHNLSAAECGALVEMLSMLDSLRSALRRAEGRAEALLRHSIHEQTQAFVHGALGPTTRKAVKHDKPLKKALLGLRGLAADFPSREARAEGMDEAVLKSKEFKAGDHAHDFPPRAAPPAMTQLWLLRSAVRALSDDRSLFAQKSSLLAEPDLSREVAKEMRSFYVQSAHFEPLLQLSATVEALSDVSFLWTREFYLELCDVVQFPTSMSLPWVLTEHVLRQRNTPLMPLLLAPLGVYNCCADAALRQHKQQHLYAEIEGELALVFEQVLFTLSEQVFAHCKTRASLMLLDPARLGGIAAADDGAAQALGRNWYAPLLAERTLVLLGRPIDLAAQLTVRMGAMLRSSVDVAISRFESKELLAVVELQAALRACRLTHVLLREGLPDLDEFEEVLAEANEAVGFLSFSSRILDKATRDAIDDLLPNCAYRQDAVLFDRPPPTAFTPPPERDKAPRSTPPHLLFGTSPLNAEYAMLAAAAGTGFGPRHAEALLEVLGEAGMQALSRALSEHLAALLPHSLSSYVLALQEALPAEIKQPSHVYGAAGCLGYYEAKLLDLRGYEELHSGVLHTFRRLGNGVALVRLLEAALGTRSTFALGQLPVEGGQPPLVAAATAVAAAWGQQAADSDMVLMAEQLAGVCAPARSSASLLLPLLARLSAELAPLKASWLGEGATALHRVWSAVQFLFCTAEHAPGLDNAALFGDGVSLAGCLVLHMLGQRHAFDLHAFNAHVLAVHLAGGAPADATLDRYLTRVALLKRANEAAFAMLEALGCEKR